MHPRPTLLVLLAMAFVILPAMAGIGMFFDGAIYASISRNLAMGIGSFWDPAFSQTLFLHFREHPPLMFGLQSVFFQVLGDSFLTERVYDFVVLVISLALTWKLWRVLIGHENLQHLRGYFWLVLLGLLSITKWSWGYQNNVLENTLTVFCLASTLTILLAILAESNRKLIFYSGFTALLLFAALLTKGLVSLFVLYVPLFAFLIYKPKISRIVLLYFIALLTCAILTGLLFLGVPESHSYLAEYFQRQLFGRVGQNEIKLNILAELVKLMAPMLLILIGTALAYRKRLKPDCPKFIRPAALMALTAASASLPLVLGDVSSRHFLLPSFPFYSLAFGFLVAGILSSGPETTSAALKAPPGKPFIVAYLLGLTFLVVVVISQFGEVRRDHEHHAFLTHVCHYLEDCKERVLFAPEAVWEDWRMHAIGQRHFQVSIASEKNDVACAIRFSSDTRDEKKMVPINYSGHWVLVALERTGGCSFQGTGR